MLLLLVSGANAQPGGFKSATVVTGKPTSSNWKNINQDNSFHQKERTFELGPGGPTFHCVELGNVETLWKCDDESIHKGTEISTRNLTDDDFIRISINGKKLSGENISSIGVPEFGRVGAERTKYTQSIVNKIKNNLCSDGSKIIFKSQLGQKKAAVKVISVAEQIQKDIKKARKDYSWDYSQYTSRMYDLCQKGPNAQDWKMNSYFDTGSKSRQAIFCSKIAKLQETLKNLGDDKFLETFRDPNDVPQLFTELRARDDVSEAGIANIEKLEQKYLAYVEKQKAEQGTTRRRLLNLRSPLLKRFSPASRRRAGAI